MAAHDPISIRGRLIADVVCPACRSGLRREASRLICRHCGQRYEISPANTPIMLVGEAAAPPGGDWLDGIKTRFKQALPGVYPALAQVVSPVLPTGKSYAVLLDALPGENALILNLGSGTRRLSHRVANVDIAAYRDVDLVADVTKLPFADRSVDGIINVALLEHVSGSAEILAESHRVLKTGGYIYSVAPFLQAFHASPRDYYRWTLPGLIEFHARQGFTRVEAGVRSGPSSALAWVLHEWLALLLSFNSRALHHAWHLVLMPFLALLKLPDLLLARYDGADTAASAFYYLGQKA